LIVVRSLAVRINLVSHKLGMHTDSVEDSMMWVSYEVAVTGSQQ